MSLEPASIFVHRGLQGVVLASTLCPRRPNIFAAFDGEEVQAQGSLAYAQHLRAEGSTPLVINLDGAAQWDEAVWVEASGPMR